MSSPSDAANETTENGWGMGRVVTSVRRVRDHYSTDLAAVSLFVLFAVTAVEVLPAGSTVRFVIALPTLVFLPGYACLAVLFPGTAESTDSRWTGLNRGLDTVERAGLSFGLSVAIVPLVLLAVGAVRPLTLDVVLGSIAALTLLLTQGALLRRLRLPPGERYGNDLLTTARTAYDRAFADRDVAGRAATVLLVVGLVVGAGSVTVAVANPPDANAFTEFYVGTETEDGDVVASGYPDEIGVDESTTLTFGVENHEQASQEYVVVVQLQRVEDGDVVARDRLGAFDETVPAGGTWQRATELSPDRTGDDLRVTYLLYRGEPPAEPTTENAYRSLHVWIEVIA